MVHNIDCKKTDRKIDDSYKIVIEENEHALFIAKELAFFLKKSGGLALKIVKNKNALKKEGKYISIGKTDLAKNNGIRFDREALGYNGFLIKTVGDNVFMGGYGPFGTIYSGYCFLEQTIRFEAFNQNDIQFSTLDCIPLYDFDVIDRPDFEWRYYDTEFRRNMRACRSLRFVTWQDMWMGGWHSFFKYVPKEEYFSNREEGKNHPLWYSHNQRQLCLHVHGNEEEKEKLVDVIVEKMKREIKENPDRTVIGFTQEDAWDLPEEERWCRCPACLKSREKYGTDAAVMIQFSNLLGERIENWIKTNDEGVPHDREVYISFFAYTVTKDAPVKEGKNGEWEPIDDSVKCRDNVFVLYAPIEADWTKSFYDPINGKAILQSDKWRALSKKLFVWIYQTDFTQYLYPFNSFDVTKDIYQFFYDRETYFMYNEGQFNQSRGTGFNDLKLYLDSKLLWNMTLEPAKLIDYYFERIYGPAKDVMRKMFEEEKAQHSLVYKKLEEQRDTSFTIADKRWWDKPLLEKWLDYTKQAFLAIKPLWKEDRKEYIQKKKSILQETIFPRYALLTLYEDEFEKEELIRLRKEFYNDTVKLNVDWLNEPTRMKKGLEAWK